MAKTLHGGIFGPTMCGKTTLATQLCAEFEKRGTRCLVLDPYYNEWPCSFQTRKMGEFIAKAKASRGCALFVDEAGQLDLRDPEHEWLLTGSRHWGHVCHIIGQSGIQLSPLGRASITRLYLFRSSEQTAKYWKETFIDDRILSAVNLKRWQFIHAEMMGEVKIKTLALT